jgi:hypothetical protein
MRAPHRRPDPSKSAPPPVYRPCRRRKYLNGLLSAAISAAGGPDPDRAAEVLLYRFVNYEADNLVFATIYAVFFVVALILSGVCLALWVWRRPHAPSTRLIG